jgi:hypothetical protein
VSDKSSTTTINSQAEATALASCKSIKGSVLITSAAVGDIDLSGPSEITGSLSILDNGEITTISSKDLTKVGDAFIMRNVTKVNSISLPKLSSVGSIGWQSLNNLETLVMSLSQAGVVNISDTFLKSLDAISLTTVQDISIDNNRFLSSWSAKLTNLTGTLKLQANNQNFDVKLEKLTSINNMEISNVTSFTVPALQKVDGQARFFSNKFEKFTAPNLTVTNGIISFIGNDKLKSVDFPELTSSGALDIINNTAMTNVSGFASLQQVKGSVNLFGSFSRYVKPFWCLERVLLTWPLLASTFPS